MKTTIFGALLALVVAVHSQRHGPPHHRGHPPPRNGPPHEQGNWNGGGRHGRPNGGNGSGQPNGGSSGNGSGQPNIGGGGWGRPNGGRGGGGRPNGGSNGNGGGQPNGGGGGWGGRPDGGSGGSGRPDGGSGGSGGGGGRRGGNTNEASIMQRYAEVKGNVVYAKNSSAQCSERQRLNSKLTEQQFYQLVSSHVQNQNGKYTLGGCSTSRGGGPGMSCASQSQLGNCDNGQQAIKGIYMEDEQSFGNYRLILSNGIPKHCYNSGQERRNPNQPCEHYVAMMLPKNPSVPQNPTSRDFKEQPMGAVGISISGAFMYNHKSAESTCNLAAITEKPSLDSCDGHADPSCRYHYHSSPVCIPGWAKCNLMGYMHDGVPVYGGCNIMVQSGKTFRLNSCWKKDPSQSGCSANHYSFSPDSNCQLDMANGYRFKENAIGENGQGFAAGTYAYFFTPEYPFIMPYYLGQSAQGSSNRWQRGPPNLMCNVDVSRY